MPDKSKCEGCDRYAYYVEEKHGQDLCGTCRRRGPRKERRKRKGSGGKLLAAWFFID